MREIALNMGISRQQLASLFRASGIQLRLVSPSPAQADEVARADVRRESLKKTGSRLGFCADTIRKYLLERGVYMRDTDGRYRAT